jgi:hypothetical protein
MEFLWVGFLDLNPKIPPRENKNILTSVVY